MSGALSGSDDGRRDAPRPESDDAAAWAGVPNAPDPEAPEDSWAAADEPTAGQRTPGGPAPAAPRPDAVTPAGPWAPPESPTPHEPVTLAGLANPAGARPP